MSTTTELSGSSWKWCAWPCGSGWWAGDPGCPVPLASCMPPSSSLEWMSSVDDLEVSGDSSMAVSGSFLGTKWWVGVLCRSCFQGGA
eukprot:765594-Hanusia_phi.AAC.2